MTSRPCLSVGASHLQAIASFVGANSAARARFTRDPVGFLNEHNVPVTSCRLFEAAPVPTSESCTLNVVCVATVAVAVYAAAAVAAWLWAWVVEYGAATQQGVAGVNGALGSPVL